MIDDISSFGTPLAGVSFCAVLVRGIGEGKVRYCLIALSVVNIALALYGLAARFSGWYEGRIDAAVKNQTLEAMIKFQAGTNRGYPSEEIKHLIGFGQKQTESTTRDPRRKLMAREKATHRPCPCESRWTGRGLSVMTRRGGCPPHYIVPPACHSQLDGVSLLTL